MPLEDLLAVTCPLITLIHVDVTLEFLSEHVNVVLELDGHFEEVCSSRDRSETSVYVEYLQRRSLTIDKLRSVVV
jgi:hypothetical protein